ncbi:MAG: tetratricopeptide repeat protein [Terriglobales bacterium]
MNHIGKVYSYQGDYDLAMEYHQKSLALCERLADNPGLAAALKNIGIIHRLRGNYPLALSYYTRRSR